ncbi:N-acetylmuramoyl-L-alanine amidase [Kordiimonas aestuarii]|uniref:N-acetylmuramoyl-L-alanine amidase n=1 Tax=Kordiimonas aestuarii TaxID=1005925 RepID=UPI0021D1583E|nr:N-acetylmuramoyl-L-alanine amidase [Kordiimonas aestuarii]
MPDIILHPSPNWNERPAGAVIDTVVLHYTGMATGQVALERLCDKVAQVSAHYLIEEDGRVFALVPEEKRAWHAGVSRWRGVDNLNHTSIGIELVNPGHDFGYRAFPEAQVTSLLSLLEGINTRHHINRHGYVGHSDIAPDRKQDPGDLFPWQRLARHGFGLWPQVGGADVTVIAKRGQKNVNVVKFNKQLGIIGYSIDDIQSFDATTECAVRAFQAHWRPETVSGVIDIGTASILEDIAGQLGQ